MRVILRLTNSKSTEARFFLEPWAQELVVPTGEKVEVEFTGPDGGDLEMEFKEDETAVYGWEGSVMSILKTS